MSRQRPRNASAPATSPTAQAPHVLAGLDAPLDDEWPDDEVVGGSDDDEIEPWPEGEGPGPKPEFSDDDFFPEARTKVVRRPLVVRVTGMPEGLPEADRRALVGHPPERLAALPPIDAAVLVRTLHGLSLGGSVLGVVCDLGPTERLPRVPRDRRFDRSRWDRRGPWLAHVDDEGRRSLTPESLARRMATLLRDRGIDQVIDLYAGCGGNTVAFAEAGLSVTAVEVEAPRLLLLQRNLRARRVHAAVSARQGDASAVAAALVERAPRAAIFLDPPWGGPEAASRSSITTTEELLHPAVVEVIPRAGTVLLKLPRGFDLRTLPPRPAGWTFGSWSPGPSPHGGYLPTILWALA